jgi:hypothetical protein
MQSIPPSHILTLRQVHLHSPSDSSERKSHESDFGLGSPAGHECYLGLQSGCPAKLVCSFKHPGHSLAQTRKVSVAIRRAHSSDKKVVLIKMKIVVI